MKIKQKLFNRLLEPSINKILFISWNNYIYYMLSHTGQIDFDYNDFNLEFNFDKSKLDLLVSSFGLDNFEMFCEKLNVGLKEFQK